ncbi:MAG: MFS transporter [Nakamurella sp.]
MTTRASDPAAIADRPPSLLSREYRSTGIGIFALVALTAFEALALTTVMPVISADLDGAALYAAAFAGTLVASVVSVVYGGNLVDRRGPRPAFVLGLAFFAAGLVLAALAPDMVVFVVARLLQGLGAGLTNTALYVLVVRVYPEVLRVKVFAGFSAAWVLPSIFGPFLAGVITDTLGWRWVFGVSIIILVIAASLLVRILKGLAPERTAVPWRRTAIISAVVLAVAVMTLNTVAEHPALGWILGGVVALAIAAWCVTRLTPRGTLRAGTGLPAGVLARGLAFGSFAGAEIYIPRLLTARDGYPPTLAGLALSICGVTWFLGSTLQGRIADRMTVRTAGGLAGLAVLVGMVGIAASVLLSAPAWTIIAIWPLVGFGLGSAYPRVTDFALARADDDEEGFVSAALQISDSTAAATALAVAAVVFTLLSSHGSTIATSFGAVFLIAAVPALLMTLVSRRVR